MPGVFDPEVYGEPVYTDALIDPEVYGENADEAGTNANAETASGSGAAADATVGVVFVSASAWAASGTGTASDSTTALFTQPSAAASTGTALDPITTHSGRAGVATGTGSSAQAYVSIAVETISTDGSGPVMFWPWAHVSARPGTASGTAQGYVGRIQLGAGYAPGTGTGYNASILESPAPRPRPSSIVKIRYDGNDITGDVILAGASFTSMVNGTPGSARFKIRDSGQTYDITSGGTLTLDIDGTRMWGGYVVESSKVFLLPVVDATRPSEITRVWSVTGVDYNVLFSKRVVWDPDHPTTKLSYRYGIDTYDDTIIKDIFDHYLDIDDDGLSRDGVQRIDKVTLDVPGHAHFGTIASTSDPWDSVMYAIRRATGGIFYIDPFKVLHYVDVDTADSPYTLTDVPTASFDIGYQTFELSEDGSHLINDMLYWGAGTGSKDYVFSRTQDSASQALHGHWQFGAATGSLYRQTSADIVSRSYVYGTPQSQRGGKDDAIEFSCRVFEPVFWAGLKVLVKNHIFGYEDVVPIRQITISFASPTSVYFDLKLGHLIDAPNVIAEFPKIPIPQTHEPNPNCTPAVWTQETRSGIPGSWKTIDDFNRTVPTTIVDTNTAEGEYWGISTNDESFAPTPYGVRSGSSTGTFETWVSGQLYIQGLEGSLFNAIGWWGSVGSAGDGPTYLFDNALISFEVEVNFDDTLWSNRHGLGGFVEGVRDDTTSYRAQLMLFGPWLIGNYPAVGEDVEKAQGVHIALNGNDIYHDPTPIQDSGTRVFKVEYDRAANAGGGEARAYVGGIQMGTVDTTGWVVPSVGAGSVAFWVHSMDAWDGYGGEYGGLYGMRINWWKALTVATPAWWGPILWRAAPYTSGQVFVTVYGLPAIPMDTPGLIHYKNTLGEIFYENNPTIGTIQFWPGASVPSDAEVLVCTLDTSASVHVAGSGTNEGAIGGYNINTLAIMSLSSPSVVRITLNDWMAPGWYIGILNDANTSDQYFFDPQPGVYLIAIQEIPETWYLYAWSSDNTFDPDLVVDLDYEILSSGGSLASTDYSYIASYGWSTEIFTATAVQTVFQLAKSFLRLSARVSVDGFRYPSFLYTEDPANGIITFVAGRDAGQTIDIRYYSTGDISE